MNKKNLNYILLSITVFIIAIISICTICFKDKKEEVTQDVKSLEATVMASDDNLVMVQDMNNIIYTFNIEDVNVNDMSTLKIEYIGELNKLSNIQDVEVVNYEVSNTNLSEDIPASWQDNGIFSKYYIEAYNKLKGLSLEDKIGQLLLVRHPNNAVEDLKKYKFGGFVFFERDFKDKYEEDVINMINNLQNNTTIPLLTAVDEEGGKITRISSNPNLVKEKFKSSKELYDEGGLDLIRQDTIDKSKILKNLGINVNLAPVVDVSTNSSDYMYERTIGYNTEITSNYAEAVIESSKNTGVSYTLKHFPGYGNNKDTHNSESIDNRTYESILKNDIPPFKKGIDAGAEAVLVSHNIVSSIDPDSPASLSSSIHNLLVNELNFTGVSITDDLDMGAVLNIDNKYVKALLAGNDLLIVTNYENAVGSIKDALKNGTLNESVINKSAFKILAWKYYKGLLFENEK